MNHRIACLSEPLLRLLHPAQGRHPFPVRPVGVPIAWLVHEAEASA
ncbi:hypothetical protein [Streptomyces sp. NBC_01431]|nr:hypothetical protein [Streptomyces sp. NBC_01431]